jgi:hypothetical protein
VLGLLVTVGGLGGMAQGMDAAFPKKIEAGTAFSVQLQGSGEGTLYVVGPGQVLKRDVRLGTTVYFQAGSLPNAGHYVAFLTGGDPGTSEFDVVAASKPADLSFLAKPSRLPVSQHDGISGAVYVFDAYHNLVTSQIPVQFQLTNPTGAVQTRSMEARFGTAWVEFDSTPQQGTDKFIASAGDIASTRIVRQVPGDPCAIKMSASAAGPKVQLTTEPVRDCSGNAIPDGTIINFTQTYDGAETTVDVPLKRGIAEVEMPSHAGSTITVASGVVLGNQIRWEK